MGLGFFGLGFFAILHLDSFDGRFIAAIVTDLALGLFGFFATGHLGSFDGLRSGLVRGARRRLGHGWYLLVLNGSSVPDVPASVALPARVYPRISHDRF